MNQTWEMGSFERGETAGRLGWKLKLESKSEENSSEWDRDRSVIFLSMNSSDFIFFPGNPTRFSSVFSETKRGGL